MILKQNYDVIMTSVFGLKLTDSYHELSLRCISHISFFTFSLFMQTGIVFFSQ